MIVRLWDVGRRETVAVLEPAGVGIPSRISFSSDGKLLAAPVGLGRIAVWTREGKVVAELGRQVVSGVTEAVFSPRDKWLVSGDRAGFVQVRGIESRKRISLFPGAHNDVKMCVFDIAFSPDGRVLAVSDFDHDIVHLFDRQSLVPKGMLNMPDDAVKSIAFSPDSRYLATGGGAGTVWIWKMATQQMVASFAAHTEGPDYRINSQEWALGGVDWSPDGKLIATSGIEPATVKLWEIRVEE